MLSDDDRVRLKTEPEAPTEEEEMSASDSAARGETGEEQEAMPEASNPEDAGPEDAGPQENGVEEDEVATDRN